MEKTIQSKKYQRFIKNLIDARKSANLKQIDVAKKLNRPQSYISRVESGEYRVDVLELQTFTKLYKTSIKKLLDF